jgi:predicted DNA-binding protein
MGMKKMLSIRLNADIEKEMDAVVAAMNITKAAFMRAAIIEYLEDRSDYIEACKVLEEENSKESFAEFKASNYDD